MSKTTIKAALALDTVWKLSTEANRGGIDCKKKAHPDFMGQPGCASFPITLGTEGLFRSDFYCWQ